MPVPKKDFSKKAKKRPPARKPSVRTKGKSSRPQPKGLKSEFKPKVILKKIAPHQTEMLVRYSPEGVVLYVNDTVVRYAGLPRKDILGKTFWGSIHNDDVQRSKNLVASLSPEAPSFSHEHRVVLDNGSVRWHQWTNVGIFDKKGRLVECQAVGRDITSQKEAELELKREKELLDAIIRSSSDGICMTKRNGDVLFMTPSVPGIMGVTPEDMKNTFDCARKNLTDRQEYEMAAALWRSDMTLKSPPERVFKIVGADGRKRWIRFIMSHMPGGNIILSCRDITSKKEIDDEFENRGILLSIAAHAALSFLSKNELDKSIGELLGAIGETVRADRVYIFENFVSPQNGELCCSQKYEWTGKDVSKQIDSPLLKNMPYSISATLHNTLSSGKCFWGRVKDFRPEIRKMMEEQDVRLILLSPVIIKGIFWGFIGLDICGDHKTSWKNSEMDALALLGNIIGNAIMMKRSEDELQESKRKAEAAALEASEATRAKSEFLSNINHEIRTPLNSIIGTINILGGTKLTEEQAKYVETLQYSGKLLLSLLNNTLDLSKIEAGKLERDEHPFSLRDLMLKFHSSMLPQAEAKGLSLNLHIQSANMPKRHVGDSTRLKQVLCNLLDNAVKFTKSGGVDIFVSCGEERNGRQAIHFKVRDTGMGIPENKIHALFEKFTQVDASTSRRFGGSGLGLSICKKLVEIMGGQISVDSVLGEGSTFAFTVVMSPLHDFVEKAREDDKFAAAPEWSRAPMILLAEDSASNQNIASHVIKKAGCEVDLAMNGIEAVSKAGEKDYDLIFMDIQMPELDGFQATKIILEQARTEGRKIPVVVALTANALESEKEKYLACGISDCIFKPFEVNDLNRVLAGSLPGLLTASDGTKSPQEETKKKKPQASEEGELPPLIDAEAAIKRINGDLDLYKTSLEMIFPEWASAVASLEKAVYSVDFKTVQRWAHTLKGSAGFAGGVRLEGLALALEKAAKGKAPREELKEKFYLLRECLAETRDALSKLYL